MIEQLLNYFDQNIVALSFFLIFCILALRNTNIQIIALISGLFYILVNYSNVKKVLIDIEKSNIKPKHIIQDNIKSQTEIHMNDNIKFILKELHQYKRYNKNAYREGYKYIKLFLYTLHELEHNDIKHGNISYDNCFLYLRESVNSFQSITIAVPQESFYHSIKNNNFKENKLENNIGKLCKELYREGYNLLTNLSLKLNDIWSKNPDRFMKQIEINSDETFPATMYQNTNIY